MVLIVDTRVAQDTVALHHAYLEVSALTSGNT
jgi:hypothetical protein